MFLSSCPFQGTSKALEVANPKVEGRPLQGWNTHLGATTQHQLHAQLWRNFELSCLIRTILNFKPFFIK